MKPSPDYAQLIELAELQFRLSIGIRAHCAVSKSDAAFTYPSFSFGRHLIPAETLSLNIQQERIAASALEHSATYLLAVQIDTAFQHHFSGRSHSSIAAVRRASQIARLIRNAFAHDPFRPTWLIPQGQRNNTYSVPCIIRLSTTGLHGNGLNRMHYGGPLALLKLARFARHLLGRHAANQSFNPTSTPPLRSGAAAG